VYASLLLLSLLMRKTAKSTKATKVRAKREISPVAILPF